MKYWLRIGCVWLGVLFPVTALAGAPWLAEMTSPEIEAAIASGTRQVVIPTGGTEQNGAHLITGKHHYIVAAAAEKIAKAHGKTLIAPVLDYVPEGEISPPVGHMRFAGTLSLRESTFKAVLQDTARSLKQHGFTHIYLLGDHGGSQKALAAVATRLTRAWQKEGVKVIHLSAYYADHGGVTWLLSQGYDVSEDGHADLRDSSELGSVYPAGLRVPLVGTPHAGAVGSAKGHRKQLGNALIDRKVAAALSQME